MPAPPQSKSQPEWTLVFADEPGYRRFLKDFENGNEDDLWLARELVKAASTFGTVRQVPGMFRTLGKGLFEVRLRRNPRVLVRLFFYLEAKNVIRIVWFYNKKKNPSTAFQQKQIKIARKKH